jgi:hypothetical protein
MAAVNERQELSDPKGYLRKMMSQVGGRDPLEVLGATPRVLAELVRGHPPDVLRRRPFEGKWTPTEVIGHMIDTDFTFGYRIRTIFADDRPTIIGMDQDRWVSTQAYNDRDAGELVADLSAVRAVNLKMYRLVTPAAYERVGVHNERGEEKLGDILRYAAGHDLWHVDQFKRYAEAANAM